MSDSLVPSSSSVSLDSRLAADVAAIGRIEAVKTVLRLLLQTTGLRLGMVARVTAESWTCCAVLRDAQLLSAKEAAQLREQLLGIVSHDLRNPLNAITLSAATLMRRTDLDDRARRGLSRILESSDRANRLIRDLLDFTQARMGKALPVKRQPMDLHVLTQQVVDEVGLATPARRFDLEAQGDARGSWDPDRIAQVLTNLLTNAVQYSPPGTPIRVKTVAEAGRLVLSVCNEGPPIPEHVRATLFEPMTRGTEECSERRSIGLGLFIVEQIVRAHGGSVEVESTGELGTTFRVHLPREG